MTAKQCAILTANKRIVELDSLLVAIQNDRCCFAYVDMKNIAVFDSLQEKYSDVKFNSEYSMNGGYEHLLAILHLLRRSTNEKDWDYGHVIFGEDYSIISPRKMSSRLDGENEIFIKPFLATGKYYLSHKRYAYRLLYVLYVYYLENSKNTITICFNMACVAA